MNRQELKELLNKIKTSNEYPSSIDIDGMNYVIANISTDLFEDFEDIADDDVLFKVYELIDEGNEEYYTQVTDITLEDLFSKAVTVYKEIEY